MTMSLKKYILALHVFLLATGLVISYVNAKTETFTVPPNREVTINLDLKEDDRVSLGFSVIGGSSKELNFYVTDSEGKIIHSFENIGQKSLSFSVTVAGTYTLHFDNSLSSESRSVTLNYDVTHFIMGMPQTLFLVVVIGVVLVATVAAFVLLGKS